MIEIFRHGNELGVLEQPNLLEEMLLVRSFEDLLVTTVRHVRRIGFDDFLYGIQIGSATGVSMPFLLHGSLKKWCERYTEKNYDQIDPIVTYASRRYVPMFWDGRYYRSSNAAQLFEEGISQGLGCGLVAPMHGAGLKVAFVNLVVNAPECDCELNSYETLGRAQILSCYFHEAFQKLESLVDPDAIVAKPLSGRELECLRWSAEGKTSWEIARILALSERTIVFHLSNAAQKLGAVNRRQAVVRAIALRLIVP